VIPTRRSKTSLPLITEAPEPEGGDTFSAMAKVARFDRFLPLSLSAGERVFILTGAGISAESGIRTFRDARGLWEDYRVEDVASPEGWARDPVTVWRFYSQRRAQAAGCEPNPAHVALGELGRKLGEHLFLCTQNVDPLHERAGSSRVMHMHGELFRSRCDTCDAPDFADDRTYFSREAIPRCPCGGMIRPHIVWFGEVPFGMSEIGEQLDASDVFVTIGSSGVVYPAAGFVRQVRSRSGVRAIYVGPEAPENAEAFDECRLGKAGEVVPALFG
jgi:NAD-dependent deacetylase